MATVNTDRLVRVFLKIRSTLSADSKAWEMHKAHLKSQMKQIEVELLRRALAEGVDGYSVKGMGTTYINEEWHISIVDDPDFFEFIRESGDLDFFERRVSLKHLKAYQKLNKGMIPPGLRVFRENRMRVRASKKKGVVDDDDDASDD